MPHDVVIRYGRIEPDPWRFLDAEEAAGPLPPAHAAVPLAAWRARRPEFLARAGATGVWLEPGDDLGGIAPDLGRLALVAVRFPKFTDGRGYSIATLLRTRHAYSGELRAIGDVGRDQLFALARVGFDAFVLPPHRDPEAALASFRDFGMAYQASADSPLPLFRRRLAAGSLAPEASRG